MGAKLLSLLKSREVIIALVSLLVIVVTNWYQGCRVSDLEEDKERLTNTIEERDSLRLVLSIAQGENVNLWERHARIEDDWKEALKREVVLRRYLKEKDGRILALVQSNSELVIENENLKGERTSDTTATFKKGNQHYHLSAKVTWPRAEPPTLGIDKLSIYDSSTVAILETGDEYILGVITHSNPLITERNARFRIPRENQDATAVSFFGYRGLWASGSLDILLGQDAAVGVGFEVLGIQTSPYMKFEKRGDKLNPGVGIEFRIGGR